MEVLVITHQSWLGSSITCAAQHNLLLVLAWQMQCGGGVGRGLVDVHEAEGSQPITLGAAQTPQAT
jgi:hypothetical protein